MGKVRVELVPDFGPRKGTVLPPMVVEAKYEVLLLAAQNKLKLKKNTFELWRSGECLRGDDLSALLHNGDRILVRSAGAEVRVEQEAPAVSKKARKAVEQLQLVPAGGGALSARGRPNLETLAALKHLKGITGVVSLLRHDEATGAAADIGAACERLQLKWCHAPLLGPREMGMIGSQPASVTAADLKSFRKVAQLKTWLQQGEQLVVHCAAGLHRTGIFLYVLLRELGDKPTGALEQIQQMRQETFHEFVEMKFQAKAEAIFLQVRSRGTSSAPSEVLKVVEQREGHGNAADDEELAEDSSSDSG